MIEGLRDRDPTAMEVLLRDWGPLMRYIMAPILPDPREQEECLHDISMRIWNRIGSFDQKKGSFSAWLTAITRNTAVNRARSGEKHRAGTLAEETPDTQPGPEALLLQKERREQLAQALAGLSQRERALFYRKYWYRQSMAQIAAETGMTLRAAEGRLYRIRKRLQEALGGGEDL